MNNILRSKLPSHVKTKPQHAFPIFRSNGYVVSDLTVTVTQLFFQ